MFHVRKVMTKREKEQYTEWLESHLKGVREPTRIEKQVMAVSYWAKEAQERASARRAYPIIPSHVSSPDPTECTNHSIMDPMQLNKEAPAVQAAIIQKSQRIAPHFNKGAHQFVSEDMDMKTLGRKSRRD